MFWWYLQVEMSTEKETCVDQFLVTDFTYTKYVFLLGLIQLSNVYNEEALTGSVGKKVV